MKNHSFTYTSIAMLVALAITIAISPTYIGNMKPAYAQSTPDTTSSPTISPDTGSPTGTGASDDGENFQQFMECLFGGEASEEDISSAIDGTGESTPTEQEIRDYITLQVLPTPQPQLAVVRLLRLTMQVKVERVATAAERQMMKAKLKIS
jgi:hypothetical protein